MVSAGVAAASATAYEIVTAIGSAIAGAVVEGAVCSVLDFALEAPTRRSNKRQEALIAEQNRLIQLSGNDRGFDRYEHPFK